MARIVEKAQASWPCGCRIGSTDISSTLIRYLWYKSLNARPEAFTEETVMQSIARVEASLSPLTGFRATPTGEKDGENPIWRDRLKGQEGKVLLFATSPRILDYFRPLVKRMDREFVLLTMIPLPDDFEMPENGTAVNFVFTKARLHRNAEMEQSLPWFFNFANSIGWFIEILSPSLLVCMDGCQSEYRLAAAFCKEKGIPSVCLQFGWPSCLHTGFRDLPYTHFLTWGEGFNSLWAKRNRSTAFHAAGYMCNADRCGKHDAITFFLQAPVFLNTEEYLQRMCALAAATAKSYPGVTVMVREHPEHKGKTDLSSLFAPFGNVVIASDDRIEEVYAGTKAVVSHFSSVLMECLAYGCTPIVFDPTPGSRYSPDVETLGLGFVSKSEEEFFQKLPCCLELPPPHGLRQWFEAVGEDAAANIAGFVNSLSR